MKIVFFLENNQYLEVEPENLQLRQVSPGQASLGVTLERPKQDAEGLSVLDENDKPVMEPAFASLVNYAVDIRMPKAKKKTSNEANA